MTPRHDFRAPNVMYCIFIDSHSPVSQICVPKNQTITGSFFISLSLVEIEKHYNIQRPKTGPRGLRLLHDALPKLFRKKECMNRAVSTCQVNQVST